MRSEAGRSIYPQNVSSEDEDEFVEEEEEEESDEEPQQKRLKHYGRASTSNSSATFSRNETTTTPQEGLKSQQKPNKMTSIGRNCFNANNVINNVNFLYFY